MGMGKLDLGSKRDVFMVCWKSKRTQTVATSSMIATTSKDVPTRMQVTISSETPRYAVKQKIQVRALRLETRMIRTPKSVFGRTALIFQTNTNGEQTHIMTK